MEKYHVNITSTRRCLVSDTITILGEEDADSVVVSASHGGLSSAQFALEKRVAAAFFNDAGGGKDAAGLAGLGELDKFGVPAAVFDHRTAAIGDGRDSWEHGVVSQGNDTARRWGVTPGMTVQRAAAALVEAELFVTRKVAVIGAGLLRGMLRQSGSTIVLIDSISMISPADAGSIVVSGSHGAPVSADFALRYPPSLAVFCDAGIGKGEAGVASLEILQAHGIAALAVRADSARIGDSLDVLANGVISRSNFLAEKAGFRQGQLLLAAIRSDDVRL